MSKVKVNTLTSVDGTVSVDVKDLLTSVTLADLGIDKKQLATAWVKFNSSGIIDSYNIASQTVVTASRYKFTFTTPMDNADYVVVGSATNPTTDGLPAIQDNVLNTTTDVSVQFKLYGGGAITSVAYGYLIVHGGKN